MNNASGFGHSDDENVRKALSELRNFAVIVKVLGSYPTARMPE